MPTEKGLSIYQIVKDKLIANVSLTGSWECGLADIEKGKSDSSGFNIAIINYTRQVTKELLHTQIDIADNSSLPCPKCKSAKVRVYPKVAKCGSENCGFVIFKNICEKTLSDKQITELLTKGKTSVIKGFKSKAGKSFDAALKLDKDFKVVFEFNKK
jgi:DNA topoisomerase-3